MLCTPTNLWRNETLPPPAYLLRLCGCLAVITVALTTAGCDNSDLRPGQIVTNAPPPQFAAAPVWTLPTAGNPLIRDFDLRVAYDHSGSRIFSQAATQLFDASGSEARRWTDRKQLPRLDEYYNTTVKNGRVVSVPAAGSYSFRATYATYSPRFSEPGGFREVAGTRPFRICDPAVPGCSSVRMAAPVATHESPEREYSERDDDWNLSTGCNSGGSSGPGIPAHLRTRVHTAAGGPYFVTTRPGGSVSEGEIEAMLRRMNAEQLDGIADIVAEAYGEDVRDHMRVSSPTTPAQSVALAEQQGESPFLALIASIGLANPESSGRGMLYHDGLSQLREQYEATRRAPAEPREDGRGTGKAEAATTASAGAFVWPNPVSQRLHIRLPGDGEHIVSIYDVQGRRVYAARATGSVAEWNLARPSGERVAPGTYRIVVSAPESGRRVSTVTVL